MATQRMNQSWRHVKTQIRSIWSEVELDDREMKRARGNLHKMVNLIHEKTGEPRDEIMQKMIAVL